MCLFPMILMLGDSLCTGFGNCVYDISSVVYVFRINRLEFFFFFFFWSIVFLASSCSYCLSLFLLLLLLLLLFLLF
jgi:hypothetical protein